MMIYYLPKTTTYYFQGKAPTSPLLPPEVKLIAWAVGITTWICFYVYYITTR